MKIPLNHPGGSVRICGARPVRLQAEPLRVTDPRSNLKCGLAQRRNESGMATVLFIALLGIMMVLVMVESRSIIRLHQEVKLLEKQQINRLSSPATNAVSTAASP